MDLADSEYIAELEAKIEEQRELIAEKEQRIRQVRDELNEETRASDEAKELQRRLKEENVATITDLSKSNSDLKIERVALRTENSHLKREAEKLEQECEQSHKLMERDAKRIRQGNDILKLEAEGRRLKKEGLGIQFRAQIYKFNELEKLNEMREGLDEQYRNENRILREELERPPPNEMPNPNQEFLQQQIQQQNQHHIQEQIQQHAQEQMQQQFYEYIVQQVAQNYRNQHNQPDED